MDERGHSTTNTVTVKDANGFVKGWAAERGLRLDWFTHHTPVSFLQAPHFVLTNYGPDGQPNGLDMTRWNSEPKYTSPRGVGSVVFAPQPDTWARLRESPVKTITEGAGGAIALNGRGIPAVSIQGCYGWKKKGSTELLDVLAQNLSPGDRVEFALDGDWRTNYLVRMAGWMFMEALRAHGCTPFLIDVPADKGIDDAMAECERLGHNPVAQFYQISRMTMEQWGAPPVDPKNPHRTAETFLATEYADTDGHLTLARFAEGYYGYVGKGWKPQSKEIVEAQLVDFLHKCRVRTVGPTITNVLRNVQAITQTRLDTAPAWRTESHSSSVLSLGNGLLDPNTRELLPHTHLYFNLNWSDVSYQPDAHCPQWRAFLSQIYPDDQQCIDLLQEWVGYCLTEDTSQQKMLMMLGAKRSGKGTIARVVQELLGRSSCTGPTLADLSGRFWAQGLLGRKLAVISDARISTMNNNSGMVENLLRLSGEDTISVQRKFLDDFVTKLNTRICMITNILPSVADRGGALASRFLILNHRVSFFGKEDPALTTKLLAELPGILNWALDGLARLQARGHFVQPDSGKKSIDELERLSAPMKAFLQECCELAPEHEVDKYDLRKAYQDWAEWKGYELRRIDETRFTVELRAASDNVLGDDARRRRGDTQHRVFVGVRLLETVGYATPGTKYRG